MASPEAPQRHPADPAELIYLPGPSLAPIVVAAGIALMVVGAYAGWFYALSGAVLFVGALGRWYRRTERAADRLPRRQQPVSAVLPPAILSRRDGRG